METTGFKALSERILRGNQQGNHEETGSFPRGKQEETNSESFPVSRHRVGNQETTPTTIDQAIEQLNSLGNWTQVMEWAPTLCNDLLEEAQEATRRLDGNPAEIQQYYRAWCELFHATQ